MGRSEVRDGERSLRLGGTIFRTHVTDGLLSTFGFDRNGDISESPVAVVRVRRGGASGRS